MAKSNRLRFLIAFLVAWPLLVFGLEPVRVAPNVYAFIGDGGEVSPANLGFVGNAGFIVGDEGVVVVDTGISYRFAGEMVAAIGRVSRKPIRLAILTHAAQEFIFGAALFQEHGIPVLAHRKSAELMRARCENCLKNLRGILGEDSMQGSTVVIPDRQITDSKTLTVGGRIIDLLYYGWGSTPGDLVVFDRESGVAFAGGLVSIGRVPDLHDGDFKGWLSALDQLSALPATHIVPGFGPPVLPADIRKTRQYLTALNAAVRTQYRKGTSLMDVPLHTPLPLFENWKQYSSLHPRNVQQIFLQLEKKEFN